jgi:hypothetical protein
VTECSAPPNGKESGMPKARTRPKKEKTVRFPKKELRAWLRNRTEWNHEEWLTLLDDLRQHGFGYWADTQERQDELGLYLEAKRAG